MTTRLMFLLAALMTAGLACGEGKGDPDGSTSCEFAVAVDSVTCAFVDVADPFASDEFHITVRGTAKGPKSTELSVATGDGVSYSQEMQCGDWGRGGASHTCHQKEGQPATTTWQANIVEGTGNGPTRTFAITSKVRQILMTGCPGEESVVKSITCAH
jgi:hypothetical protein